MKKILKVILLYVLAISSAHSAVMELTAKFSPSLLSPENNKFTNTTPLGGFCLKRPTWCISSRIEFSVSLPIDLKRSYDIPAKNAPRDGVFFKYPKYTKVNVIAENGSSHELTFNITAFNFTYSKVYEANDIGWVRGNFTGVLLHVGQPIWLHVPIHTGMNLHGITLEMNASSNQIY